MTTTHTDNAQCMFCGHQWKLSITLHPDFPFDEGIIMIRKYMAKRQDILLHKLQCQRNFYLLKLEAR